MFTFRVIEESRKDTTLPFDQKIKNFELGNSYRVLRKCETKDFDDVINKEYSGMDSSCIYGIVRGGNGCDFFLFTNSKLEQSTYYIMTDSGQTFERL